MNAEQRAKFEAWAKSQKYNLSKKFGLHEYNTTRIANAAWQACCEANGVGEPSRPDTPVEQWGDGPPPTLNDCLSLLSSYIADAMPAEAVPDDEYFAAWERLARPVLAKLYAALAKREDGVPQTVLTANAKPLFEFDERSFVDLEELKRRGFVCRIATVAVSNPETGEEKILMLPLGEE